MALESSKQEHFILNDTAAHILGTFCYSIASFHESSHKQWKKNTSLCPVNMDISDISSVREMPLAQEM